MGTKSLTFASSLLKTLCRVGATEIPTWTNSGFTMGRAEPVHDHSAEHHGRGGKATGGLFGEFTSIPGGNPRGLRDGDAESNKEKPYPGTLKGNTDSPGLTQTGVTPNPKGRRWKGEEEVRTGIVGRVILSPNTVPAVLPELVLFRRARRNDEQYEHRLGRHSVPTTDGCGTWCAELFRERGAAPAIGPGLPKRHRTDAIGRREVGDQGGHGLPRRRGIWLARPLSHPDVKSTWKAGCTPPTHGPLVGGCAKGLSAVIVTGHGGHGVTRLRPLPGSRRLLMIIGRCQVLRTNGRRGNSCLLSGVSRRVSQAQVVDDRAKGGGPGVGGVAADC